MSKWAHAISGYAKWKLGKKAHFGIQALRARTCAECPHMQVHAMDDLRGILGLLKFMKRSPLAGWCGSPGEPSENTCGCLVLTEDESDTGDGTVTLKINGEPYTFNADGKTTIESESCPCGHW